MRKVTSIYKQYKLFALVIPLVALLIIATIGYLNYQLVKNHKETETLERAREVGELLEHSFILFIFLKLLESALLKKKLKTLLRLVKYSKIHIL